MEDIEMGQERVEEVVREKKRLRLIVLEMG